MTAAAAAAFIIRTQLWGWRDEASPRGRYYRERCSLHSIRYVSDAFYTTSNDLDDGDITQLHHQQKEHNRRQCSAVILQMSVSWS